MDEIVMNMKSLGGLGCRGWERVVGDREEREVIRVARIEMRTGG